MFIKIIIYNNDFTLKIFTLLRDGTGINKIKAILASVYKITWFKANGIRAVGTKLLVTDLE